MAEKVKTRLIVVRHIQVFEVDIPCSVEDEMAWLDDCISIKDIANECKADWTGFDFISKVDDAFDN